MTQSNETVKNAKQDIKHDIDSIKEDIESIIERISNIKHKSGDITSKQLDSLSDLIHKVKAKGEKKGEFILKELCNSTQKHPVRNMLYAIGVGALISFIIS